VIIFKHWRTTELVAKVGGNSLPYQAVINLQYFFLTASKVAFFNRQLWAT